MTLNSRARLQTAMDQCYRYTAVHVCGCLGIEELETLDLSQQRRMTLERLPAGLRAGAEQVVAVRGLANMLLQYCVCAAPRSLYLICWYHGLFCCAGECCSVCFRAAVHILSPLKHSQVPLQPYVYMCVHYRGIEALK